MGASLVMRQLTRISSANKPCNQPAASCAQSGQSVEGDMPSGIEGLKASNTLTSQLITISSGLLAFTVTFAEKFTRKGEAITPPTALKIAWVCFAVTILLGFWTLMALN